MKLPPLPYYRWHWQAWRANRKVQRMSYIERGLYRELLDECWAEGFIPNDIEALADICGCPVDVMANAWQVLGKCFELHDGVYINSRIEHERTEKDTERAKRSRAGHAGGIAKSLKSKDQSSTCQASASTCHIEEKEKRREEKRNSKKESASAGADVFPDALDQVAWDAFVAHRKKIKKRLTPDAIDKQIKFLVRYDKTTQRAIVDYSVRNGYTGLFEPKGGSHANGYQSTEHDRVRNLSRSAAGRVQLNAERELAALARQGGDHPPLEHDDSDLRPPVDVGVR